MNLLFFAMIALVFPLESIANSPAMGQKKPSPITKQNISRRRPASTKSLVELKPLVPPSAIAIEPKIPIVIPPKPKGPTYFKLSKVPSKNQLIISFESYDPHLKLNTKSPLAIQFFTDYPMQLNRSLIVGSAWPKDATSLTLSFSEATPKVQNKIRGKASYTYCHNTTHKCKTVLEPILFYFIP
ncbi:MAG: hypothetical protein ABI041_09500 [Bdellovibrionia bacterium]